MSVLRQRTSQRTKKLLVAGGIGALAMGVLSSGVIIFSYHEMKKNQIEMQARYETELKQQKDLLDKEQQTKTKVFMITHDVPAGTIIKASDLVATMLPKDAVPDNMIVDNQTIIGKYSKIDIRKNTPLTKTMLYDEGVTPNDLRQQEFKFIVLPSDLKVDQFIDVRIKFPTGQDYIVTAKKKVRKLDNGTVWLQLDEKEMLLLSSSVVDAYLNHAILYAVTYVDPYVQEKPAVTYPVNEYVRTLVMSDPNVIETAKRGMESWARQNLDANLKQQTENGKGGSSGSNGQALTADKPFTGFFPDFSPSQGSKSPSDTSGQNGNKSQPLVPKTGSGSSSSSSSSSKSGTSSGQASSGQSADTQKAIFESNTNNVVAP